MGYTTNIFASALVGALNTYTGLLDGVVVVTVLRARNRISSTWCRNLQSRGKKKSRAARAAGDPWLMLSHRLGAVQSRTWSISQPRKRG